MSPVVKSVQNPKLDSAHTDQGGLRGLGTQKLEILISDFRRLDASETGVWSADQGTIGDPVIWILITMLNWDIKFVS